MITFQEPGTNFGMKTAASSENLLNNNAKNCHELKPITSDKKCKERVLSNDKLK